MTSRYPSVTPGVRSRSLCGRVVELVPGPFGPLDEAPVVREPAGRPHVAGVAVLEPVRLVHVTVDVRFLAVPARPGLSVVALGLRAHEHPAPPWPLERHLVPAGVEAATAPVVVRVPRVGGEHQQHPLAGAAGTHDEAGVPVRPVGRGAVGREVDEVEAAPPRRVGGHLDRGRPPAPGGIGIGGGGLLDACEAGGRPHGLARRAPPFDRDVVCGGRGGGAESHHLAGRIARLHAVALDRVVVGDGVGHGAVLADRRLAHGGERERHPGNRLPRPPTPATGRAPVPPA